MPVWLRRPGDIPATGWDRWAAVGGVDTGLDPGSRVPGLGGLLETAFDSVADEWLALARQLGRDGSAVLAHAPSAAPNASDLGLMMAWTRLIEGWAAASETVLVVADDAWMFRHLAGRPGILAGRSPALWPGLVKGWLRGFVARTAYAWRAVQAVGRLRPPPIQAGGAFLLVYGHPRSNAAGADAYFGDLMDRLPHLGRILHVDAGPERADPLLSGRTCSLHGWGSRLHAAVHLPFARWRPGRSQLSGPHRTLVGRAAAIEAATAQGAAVAWQIHCQGRWLRATRPAVVAWPWENHGWERAFVREARQLGTRTVGYQHSVVGRQMLNYAARSNSDGTASLPDRVLCSGAATRDQLAAWSFPVERLSVGGALRFSAGMKVVFDAAAPVFFALPFDQPTAAEMVAAARRLGRPVLVKDHPMTPFAFAEDDMVKRADKPLGEQRAVSAVVYAATTVGLEAVLAGLPTLRFRPAGRIALDILPLGLAVPTASSETLAGDLAGLTATAPPPVERVFATVDSGLWGELLSAPARHMGNS